MISNDKISCSDRLMGWQQWTEVAASETAVVPGCAEPDAVIAAHIEAR